MFLIIVSFRFSLISSTFQFAIYSYFDSGTGAAGIAGAFLWWDVRGVSSVCLSFSLLVVSYVLAPANSLHHPTHIFKSQVTTAKLLITIRSATTDKLDSA